MYHFGAYGLPDKTKVVVEASAEPGEKKPAAGEDKDDKKDDEKISVRNSST